MFLSSSLWMGQHHFNMAMLAWHRAYKVLQSAGLLRQKPLLFPLGSATPTLDPAFECQRYKHPRLDTSPSSRNKSPAWAQMSCQAGWCCCFKFTIIYFSNLISEMEVHISAHDFQLICYFLSAFQCFWNALCYRQNTLIMMGLFF